MFGWSSFAYSYSNHEEQKDQSLLDSPFLKRYDSAVINFRKGIFMISYEVYKILHVFTLLMVLASVGAILAGGNIIAKKSFKVTTGVLSFLIFVAGMGLIARLGFKHTEPFPLWVIVKMVSWGALCVCLVLFYKIKSQSIQKVIGLVCFVAVFTAVYSAITKFA
jgi:hypothetical protein